MWTGVKAQVVPRASCLVDVNKTVLEDLGKRLFKAKLNSSYLTDTSEKVLLRSSLKGPNKVWLSLLLPRTQKKKKINYSILKLMGHNNQTATKLLQS